MDWNGRKVELGKVYSNPYANAFKPLKEGEDHEVSMAQNQLDSIIKNATELKTKIGESEINLPGWIQDHITNSENYIEQANTGYHKLKV
jgi:CYTH domain-containing protein